MRSRRVRSHSGAELAVTPAMRVFANASTISTFLNTHPGPEADGRARDLALRVPLGCAWSGLFVCRPRAPLVLMPFCAAAGPKAAIANYSCLNASLF